MWSKDRQENVCIKKKAEEEHLKVDGVISDLTICSRRVLLFTPVLHRSLISASVTLNVLFIFSHCVVPSFLCSCPLFHFYFETNPPVSLKVCCVALAVVSLR